MPHVAIKLFPQYLAYTEFNRTVLFLQHVFVAVENRDTLSGYRLTLRLSFPAYTFFHCEQQHAPTFSLHDHLVATGPHALHILHLPTTRKNSCLVGIGSTRVKPRPH